MTKSTPLGSVDHPFNPLSVAIGAEASFVARAIDTDKKELTEVLRAAASHKGTAFVEVLQNCNIYNDGAFDFVREDKENRIYLRQGEEVRWGDKGVRLAPDGSAEVVAADDGPLLVHDATRVEPSVAFALSRLTWETIGAVPMGVFRQRRAADVRRVGRRADRGGQGLTRRRRPGRAPPRRRHLDDLVGPRCRGASSSTRWCCRPWSGSTRSRGRRGTTRSR